MGKLRVGVLVSGTGSLLQAIIDGQDELYEVAVVVSDRPGIRAIERAQEAGVEPVVVDWTEFGKERRADFTARVLDALQAHKAGLACSAGFMKILAPNFFAAQIPYLNSHPALLPAFPGAHGVRDALAYGVKVTGTSIIFADDGMDTGPIVAQEAVPVEEGDTEDSLHTRIKAVEQRLYPEVIRLFAAGRIKQEGRRVHILPPA